MENQQNKLKLRKAIKTNKPKFTRQNAVVRKKLSAKWRRPRGIHSKMRLGFRGYKRSVEPGWGSPADVKGLHKSGLKIVLVKSMSDLTKIDAKTEGIILSAKIGMKKAVEILNETKKKSITVLNLNVDDYLKKIEEKLKLRKQVKEEKTKKKDTKKEKIAEKKKEEEKKLTEKEEKEKEKKEKDKLLTKKGAI